MTLCYCQRQHEKITVRQMMHKCQMTPHTYQTKPHTDYLDKCINNIIKLNGMERRAPCKQIFCPFTYSRSLGWCQRVRYFFFSFNSERNHCILNYTEWSVEQHVSKYNLSWHTQRSGLKRFSLVSNKREKV